ncbi:MULTISPECIES: hypothetical protein, partial [unclassified Flavobacterium]|uniref:hypothetical protein n=1 Tax=unclassified Flavobacterium TaxID=196869 RepID=UPI00193AD74D
LLLKLLQLLFKGTFSVPSIFVLTFLIIWTIGFIYEHGILFGLSSAILFILFLGFIHKKLMELSLNEITELIKK